MRIRLNAVDEGRSYDTQLARFTDAETIPCFRCGVCCQRWQPLIGRLEADRLAASTGMETADFLAQFARPYPLEEDTHQLLERDGGCVFLRFDNGLAGCSVHEARPQSCRDWDASLLRRECLDGVRGETSPSGLLIPLRLYEDDRSNRELADRLRLGPG
jgi:Fe-S-cluster containining protein